jgi:hypothetical protein
MTGKMSGVSEAFLSVLGPEPFSGSTTGQHEAHP